MNFVKLSIILILSLIIISCDSAENKPTEPIIEISTTQLSELDLRKDNIITSVKDQGPYGTCWSFAVTGMVESMIKMKFGNDVNLSEQFLINTASELGPYGGLNQIKREGIILEEKLPYQGAKDADYNFEGKCDYRIRDFDQIPIGSLETEERLDYIKSLMIEYGPVVTHMTMYYDLNYYENGVYTYDGQSDAVYGHIILLVGWKNDPSVKNGGFWIVKNSWGNSWGEEGYFNIAYDEAETALYYVCTAEGIQKID